MVNDNEQIMKKINFFLENKSKVHIKKNNKTFLNGYFIKQISDEVYKFKDDYIGEIDLFIFDIYDLDDCIRDRKKGSGNNV